MVPVHSTRFRESDRFTCEPLDCERTCIVARHQAPVSTALLSLVPEGRARISAAAKAEQMPFMDTDDEVISLERQLLG